MREHDGVTLVAADQSDPSAPVSAGAPPVDPVARRAQTAERLSRAGAAIDLALGVFVLVWWWLNLHEAFGLSAERTMHPASALGFALAGGGLLALHAGRRRLRFALAAALALLAGLELVARVSDAAVSVDRELAVSGLHGLDEGMPGGVAVVFLAAAASLALQASGERLRRASGQGFGILVAAGGFVAVLAVLVDALLGAGIVTELAQATAGGALVLGAALVMAAPREAFTAVMISEGPGGDVARRLILGALLVLPVVAVLRVLGQEAGLFGTELGIALLTGTTLVLLAAATSVTAARLDRSALARERSRRELQATLDRVRDLYDEAPCGYQSLDENGGFVEANARTCAWLGIAREELVGGMALTDVAVDPVAAADLVAAAFAHGGARAEEIELRRRDGSTFWAEFDADVVVEAGGRRSLRATTFDVTHTREAQRARREADERFRRLVETALEGVWILGPDDRTVFANERLSELLARDAADLVGVHPADLVAPEDRRRLAEHLDGRRHGVSEQYDLTLLRSDGAEVSVIVSANPVLGPGGEYEGSFATVLDVTERRVAERQRREADERYRQIVETAVEGVWVIDAENRTTFVNGAMGAMLGHPPEDMLGRGLYDFMDEDAARHARELVERRRAGISEALEFTFRRADGSTVETYVSTAPILGEDGEYGGAVALVTDVTERRRLEAERREADARYRRIVETSLVGIGVNDARGVMVFANERLAEMLGRTREDLVGRPVVEVMGAVRSRGERDVREAFAGQASAPGPHEASFEDAITRPDGSVVHVAGSARQFHAPGGGWAGSLVMLTDITARVRAEEERRVADERYRRIVETAQEGIGLLSPEGVVTFATERLGDLLGVPAGELIGAGATPYLDEEGLRVVAEHARRAAAGGAGPEILDVPLVRRDGTRRWALVSATPLYEEDGRWAGTLGMATDITERKRAEEALRASEARLRAIVDVSPAMLTIKSLDLRYLLVNREFERFAGRTAEELVGLRAADIVDPAFAEKIERADRHVIETGEVMRTSGTAAGADGVRREWLVARFPLKDAEGEPYAVCHLSTDVTDLRRFEREVQELNQTLEARVAARTAELEIANQDLASFASSVAHDLRAPLRTVHGFASIVLDEYAEGLPPEGLRYLQLVDKGAGEMGELIDDLLTFARMGQQALSLTEIDPREVVAEALDELAGEYPQDDVEIHVAPDMPPCLADRRLLHVVYLNLLGNALKFTRGRERREIRVGWEPYGPHAVAYLVSDNGAGFDQAHADRLFAMFQRLHSHEEFDGTGLGLAIVERIVHRHGGVAWGEGAVGEGATIRFTLGAEDDLHRAGA